MADDWDRILIYVWMRVQSLHWAIHIQVTLFSKAKQNMTYIGLKSANKNQETTLRCAAREVTLYMEGLKLVKYSDVYLCIIARYTLTANI